MVFVSRRFSYYIPFGSSGGGILRISLADEFIALNG